VPFDSLGADTANAVLIPGQVEAIARLAHLHARGMSTREWFWSAAVPRWRPGLSRSEGWLILLQAAHGLPEAALAVVAIVDEALSARAENELFGSLPPGCGRTWLQLAGWSAAPVSDTSVPPIELHSRHTAIIEQWMQRWGQRSQRLIWAAAIFAVAEKRSRIADRHLPGRIAAWLTAIVDKEGVLLCEQVGAESPILEGKNSEPFAVSQPREHFELIESKSPETAREPSVAKPSRISHPIGALSDGKTASEERIRGYASEFAGLLLVVPILQRLNLSEALDACPGLIEIGFPFRLLKFIGERVGMRDDDPLAEALTDFDQATPLPDTWNLPESANRELAFPPLRKPLDSPLVAWLTAVRRWCRRHARMGLVSLICRPGEVAVSQTHLEIFFDIAAADIRLRRIALDVDPGWVRWLGRVIRFHYR